MRYKTIACSFLSGSLQLCASATAPSEASEADEERGNETPELSFLSFF